MNHHAEITRLLDQLIYHAEQLRSLRNSMSEEEWEDLDLDSEIWDLIARLERIVEE